MTLAAAWWRNASQAQTDDFITVRFRTDDAVRGVLPAISTKNLVMSPDRSIAAQELADRAPKERAAPVILIIIGAIAFVQIVRMINEMAHEIYYGGVIIDGRKTPPEISNDPKIPPTMIFVFLNDGTVKQFKTGELPQDLLKTVLKGR